MPKNINVEESSLREPVRLPTVDGDGVQPGVDLDNSADLLDLLDAPDDPDLPEWHHPLNI